MMTYYFGSSSPNTATLVTESARAGAWNLFVGCGIGGLMAATGAHLWTKVFLDRVIPMPLVNDVLSLTAGALAGGYVSSLVGYEIVPLLKESSIGPEVIGFMGATAVSIAIAIGPYLQKTKKS